ncbi:3-hydroxy-3-methylglutaryl-CoA reductase [Chryseobacterium sp. PMSZPI]|nr:3-hydroxy-3-methylglutaryl-CoA reductase [Chryseobacterium sp. PMSZPI]
MPQLKNKIDFAKYDDIDQLSIDELESYQSHFEYDFNFGKIPTEDPYTLEGQQTRLAFINQKLNTSTDYISGKKVFADHNLLKGNIENFIGMAQIPVGIAGPLVINGTTARGSFYIPMATTEGTLLASYSRGMKACRESGLMTVVCLQEGVQRCPLFKFNNIIELGRFVNWILHHKQTFIEITNATSRFANLSDLGINIDGNELVIRFEYTTGDASGQNMVTICTNQICKYIIEFCPVKPVHWVIDSNMSGDKKGTGLVLTRVRGKKITAEIVLKKEIVQSVLQTTPELMARTATSFTNGCIKSGALSTGMHPANALAALFIACGQDVACVSEACTAITRMELTDNNDLYCSITMPNMIVGTIGGGTSLPTQKECLSMMGCYGEGKAVRFAEICVALCLAGEISILAALSAGQFANAHQKFGRK